MSKNESKNERPAAPAPSPIAQRELTITRMIDAPREKVFEAWTKPELLKQWFAPKPWTTTVAEMDVRTGGSCLVTMRGPDGNEFPCHGVYLEVVPNEKIVFTDAFTKAWEPSEKAFMCSTVTLEN